MFLDPGAAPRARGLLAVPSAGSVLWEATLNAPRNSARCTHGGREQSLECPGDSFARAVSPHRFVEFLLCARGQAMAPDGRESQDRPVSELTGPWGHREARRGTGSQRWEGGPSPTLWRGLASSVSPARGPEIIQEVSSTSEILRTGAI